MRNVMIVASLASLFLFVACQKAVTTEHGYRFEHVVNTGGTKAQPGDAVRIHLYTWLGDSLMNSTRRRGSEPFETKLPSAENLKQFTDKFPAQLEAVLLMAEGDSAVIYEQLDSTMKASLPKGMEHVTEVKYGIALVDILDKEELAKKEAEAQAKQAEMMVKMEAVKANFPAVESKVKGFAKQYTGGQLASQLKSTPSGLKYIVLEEGTGAKLKNGEEAELQYYGCLTNGTMFDNSFERGQPLPVAVGGGRMIPGFDEGVALLNHGAKALLFIPSNLGYGEQASGPIPANSELIFYVEIL
jgi:FKBP-type peptidyl-prolyl cis-trans isomerase FkpA